MAGGGRATTGGGGAGAAAVGMTTGDAFPPGDATAPVFFTVTTVPGARVAPTPRSARGGAGDGAAIEAGSSPPNTPVADGFFGGEGAAVFVVDAVGRTTTGAVLAFPWEPLAEDGAAPPLASLTATAGAGAGATAI